MRLLSRVENNVIDLGLPLFGQLRLLMKELKDYNY